MRFEHVNLGIVVFMETEAGKRHCLGSPYWRAV
jgi:hypothetical protein